MKTRIGIGLLLAFTIVAGVLPVGTLKALPAAQAFTAANLTQGSRGYDVYELQHRLSHLGFYHGKADGVFGWKTYWAVRNFQYRFGLKVTGLADMRTKMKLANATSGWHYRPSAASSPARTANVQTLSSRASGPALNNVPSVPGLSASDVRLMTHVVYGEARGEPHIGQVAIAAVILNRMRDPRFPHSVPAIVYQPGAFTAVADGQVNLQPSADATKAVVEAMHGWDPSHGAVYYFNPATATSPWIWSRPQILQIGKHIFCR